MKKRINGVLLLLMSITMLFSACSKDPETKPITTDPEVKVGDILVYTMLMNPGGQTGSGWMQLADGVSPKKLTNKNAVQVGYGMMPVCNGNDVYTFPAFGAQGDENVVTKWGRSGTKLTKTATMPIPLNSVPRHISFVNATKAYLISLIGKLFIFNPQTMELTGEIDLSSYAAPGLAVPMFGSPFVHNGRVYGTLNQTDMTFHPATEPQIELAVINTQTDKVERVIYEKASGIGIGAYTYGQQTFIDEKGDMYLMCTGAYGMNPKYKTGILRIKKGETEFDPTYNWVLNDQTIEGESGKTVWLLQSQYAGNGKMYATMDIPSYWANPTSPNWFTDKSLISVEMDIYNKTVKKLPIPMTSSFGGAVEKYKNLIVFAINGRNDVGFYTHNPATGETSSDAVVKVDGAPAYFHWFEN